MSEGQFKVIINDGRSALRAAALQEVTLDSSRVQIQIRSPDWVDQVLQEINSIENTIPLAEECAVDPLELEANESLGPQVDPSLLFVEDDENDSHSGRSTPGVVEGDLQKVPPSRPPPPAKAPGRPPPPAASSTAVAAKPSRPAPPPPSKLQKQAALNPPTITKTAPSTDSETSFENSMDAMPVQKPPVQSVPSLPPAPPVAPIDPFTQVNNEWEELTKQTPVNTFTDERSQEPVTSSDESQDDDEEENTTQDNTTLPHSLPPCPPPPVPSKPPPAPPSRPTPPPPIPSRGRIPSVPPRKQ